MKAVVLKAYGGAGGLSYEEVEQPRPGPGEVLVRVLATSVNPIDWKTRSGAARERMALELPAILGRDVAGEVAETGAGAGPFAIGQRVMALTSRAYAEYALVKANELAPIPAGLSFEQAGALPLVTLTGAQLIERGVKAKNGQSVLLTGALGSVGRAAAFVAAEHHAQVIAAVRLSQLAEAESLGTLAVISMDDEEGLKRFSELDALADTVGGAPAVKLLRLLHHGGVYASVVGAPEGIEEFDLRVELVRSRPDPPRLAKLAGDAAEGRFQIPIAKVMKLAEAAEAHRLAESGSLGGKIVLTP